MNIYDAPFVIYYLSPMLVIGLAILVLIALLVMSKISPKMCERFTIGSLIAAFLVTLLLAAPLMHKPKAQLSVQNNPQSRVLSSTTNAEQNSSQTSTAVADAETTSPATTTTDNAQADDANSDESAADNPATAVATTTDSSTDSTEASSEEPATTELVTTDQVSSDSESEDESENPAVVHAANAGWQASYVTALFTFDGYALLYVGLILIITLVVCCLAMRWFSETDTEQGLFYLILLFSALGGVVLVYASHLISLFIGIELLSIPAIGLIGFQYTQTHAIEAAIKYMILSAVATTFLLMGIAFYYTATGELTFSGLSFQLSTMQSPGLLLLMGVCFMLVGIGFKLSLVPFQLWLPDVYQGAPTAVSLLLATVGKMAVFCAVARLFLLAPIVNNETIRTILMLLAGSSILVGNLFALMQHNVKRMIAYSSIANVGYVVVTLIAVQYQVLALETIGVYLIGYLLANICIFGVISLESSAHQLRDKEETMDLKGLFWRRPIMSLAMGIGLLSFCGVPLTIGFIGRFVLLMTSITAELWWLIGAMIIGGACGLFFYLRLVINLYLRNSALDVIAEDSQQNALFDLKSIRLSEAIIVIAALMILGFGIYPQPIFKMVSFAQYLMP